MSAPEWLAVRVIETDIGFSNCSIQIDLMLIDHLNARVSPMNAEVKTDDSVVAPGRENRSVTPRQDRVNPFLQDKRDAHSAEVNSYARNTTDDKSGSSELNPAQARWLNIGEKFGTWLAGIKSRLNG